MRRPPRWTRTFSLWEVEEHGAAPALRTLVPVALIVREVLDGLRDVQLEHLEIHGPLYAGAILEWRRVERDGKTHVVAAAVGSNTVLVDATVTSVPTGDVHASV